MAYAGLTQKEDKKDKITINSYKKIHNCEPWNVGIVKYNPEEYRLSISVDGMFGEKIPIVHTSNKNYYIIIIGEEKLGFNIGNKYDIYGSGGGLSCDFTEEGQEKNPQKTTKIGGIPPHLRFKIKVYEEDNIFSVEIHNSKNDGNLNNLHVSLTPKEGLEEKKVSLHL